MTDTYRGDTVGKKIARLLMWNSIFNSRAECKGTPSDMRSSKCKILYLASHEGGDASVLAAYGVAPEQQMAVDYDQEALAAFSARWPTITTRCCNIDELRRAPHERFSVIYLDFCTHLSTQLIRTITNVVTYCGRPDCELVVAYMRGREKLDMAPTIKRKGERQPTLNAIGTPIKIGDDFAPEAERGIVDGRADLLTASLNARLCGRLAVPITMITYQSRTSASPGVPMAVLSLTICPVSRSAGDRFARGQRGFVETNYRSADLSPFWTEDHLRQTVLEWRGGGEGGESLDWDSKRLGLAFNIDPHTVAAWKAHKTMGTYAKGAP